MSYGERSSVRGAAAPCWGPCRMENRRRPFAVAVRGGNVSGSVTLGLSAGCPPPLTPLLPSPHRPVVGGGFFRVWGRGGRGGSIPQISRKSSPTGPIRPIMPTRPTRLTCNETTTCRNA